MASETDIRIARAVALKAAVDMHIAAKGTPDVQVMADDFVKWLLDISAPARSDGDPGPTPPEPPDEWPEDEAIGPPLGGGPPRDDFAHTRPLVHTSGFVMVEASPCPGCGTLRVIKDGTGKDGLPWKAYMCPAKQRDESNDAHPALFLKRRSG